MGVLEDQMTTAEAAALLGVSVRQVRRLAGSGELDSAGNIGRALLLDTASVHRLRERGRQRGRPWSEETGWAAVELLRDASTNRLDAAQRSKLRQRLRHIDVEEFVRAARHRAQITRYRASGSFLEDVCGTVTLTGKSAIASDTATALAFDLAAGQVDTVDGYTTRSRTSDIVDEFFLVPDNQGNVTLRTTTRDYAGAAVADHVTVALDLAESLDTRERSAGLRVLRELLAKV